jgi:hypothetical protein
MRATRILGSVIGALAISAVLVASASAKAKEVLTLTAAHAAVAPGTKLLGDWNLVSEQSGAGCTDEIPGEMLVNGSSKDKISFEQDTECNVASFYETVLELSKGKATLKGQFDFELEECTWEARSAKGIYDPAEFAPFVYVKFEGNAKRTKRSPHVCAASTGYEISGPVDLDTDGELGSGLEY